MASNAEMVDYIWPISTNYVFGGSRYSPYNTDCSGMMCAAMWHVHGVDPYTFGDCTGAQWNGGLLRKLWWGTDPYLPWDIAQKGDFIYTSTVAPSFDTGQGSHVGLYTGDPNAPFLSHFANGGPYVTAVNGVYGGNERYFGLARYMPGSEGDMDKTELISTRDDGNIPAWEAWSWAYTYAKDAAAAAGGKSLLENEISTQASGNIPVWQAISWSYTYTKSLVDKIEAMQKTIDKLKVSGATIDYDKLSKALAPVVADELAARLKA